MASLAGTLVTLVSTYKQSAKSAEARDQEDVVDVLYVLILGTGRHQQAWVACGHLSRLSFAEQASLRVTGITGIT